MSKGENSRERGSMEQPRINVKFVSQKISKIRWRPRPKQSMQQSDTFVTGSWDDEVIEKTRVVKPPGLGL